jgi:hypothetical protein
MIILDENVHQQSIVEALAAWYRGRVVSITAIRPGTIVKDEAMPTLLRSAKQPTFVTTNVTDFGAVSRRIPATLLYVWSCPMSVCTRFPPYFVASFAYQNSGRKQRAWERSYG